MQYTLFNPNSSYTPKWYIFKETELGRIYDTINWKGLAALLPQKKTLRGCPSWLKPQGLFGLMFLKHYTGLSDEKLVERFNSDWGMQLFCGALLSDNEQIKDNAFVSRIRSYLAKHVPPSLIQDVLLKHWKTELKETNILLMDATCFESHIRFPTDVKLLWESVDFIYQKCFPAICSSYKVKQPKSKFSEQKVKYLIYSKKRKKTYKETRKRIKALLNLLQKGIPQLQQLLDQTQGGGLKSTDYAKFRTIKEVYKQQRAHFNNPKLKIANRIVSLHKPYVRPIVRGKENKPVEFGIKTHMNHVDGISILEHASFNNFNECKRLKKSVLNHNVIFSKCSHVSADGIYPTNENRRFITERKIQSNFKKKGPKKEDKAENQMKSLLNKERNSKMEGAFGNVKNHYNLRRIKARTEATEMIWVYMGIFTANAVAIAKKRQALAAEGIPIAA